MIRKLVLFTAIVFISITHARSAPGFPARISLDGTWKIKAAAADTASYFSLGTDDSDWDSIKVPANWVAEGKDLSGIVWYRCHFRIGRELSGRTLRLVFSGVDYTADVWLNGKFLGTHSGYFQKFSFDVSSLVQAGRENVLAVKVNSPLETGNEWSLHKRLIKGVFSHHDTRPGGAWTERGQEKNSGGIWNEVFLKVSKDISLDGPSVSYILRGNNAGINAKFRVVSSLKAVYKLNATIELVPFNFTPSRYFSCRKTKTIEIKPGISEVGLELDARKLELWMPYEIGFPYLYTVKISISGRYGRLDGFETVTGFRQVKYDSKSPGISINGKELFLRGTNYISTQWLSSMDEEKLSYDLGMMKAAHMNAVRVHAHIESGTFYRLCDRMGMLVWQDFPLQWGYADDSAFASEAKRQLADMISQLNHHPSVFLWSLHNEPPWDSDWMKYKYRTYSPDQNRQLDEDLYKLAAGIDSTRILQMISSNREHPWFGWYSRTWQDYAAPTGQKIISEFGAQALPVKSTLRTIFSESELWPDTEKEWAQWEYHNFQKHETFNLAKVNMGASADEFIRNTQEYQAKLVKLAAESYRMQKFKPVAAIFQFMFNEEWPSVNWGIVDYLRVPKPGYYALQTAYQPLLVMAAMDSIQNPRSARIFIINDLHQDFSLLNFSLEISQTGKLIKSESLKTSIGINEVKMLQMIGFGELKAGEYDLVLMLKDVNDKVMSYNCYKIVKAEN